MAHLARQALVEPACLRVGLVAGADADLLPGLPYVDGIASARRGEQQAFVHVAIERVIVQEPGVDRERVCIPTSIAVGACQRTGHLVAQGLQPARRALPCRLGEPAIQLDLSPITLRSTYACGNSSGTCSASASSAAAIRSAPLVARVRSTVAMNASTSEITTAGFSFSVPASLSSRSASRPPAARPTSSWSRSRFLTSQVCALSRLRGSRARGAQTSSISSSGFTPGHRSSGPYSSSGAAATRKSNSSGLLGTSSSGPPADQRRALSQS